MKRLILSLVAFLLLPQRAEACTLLDWNWFAGYYQPSIFTLASEARTIDWVTVRTTGPQKCPRPPDPDMDPAKWEAFAKAEMIAPDLADPCLYVPDPPPGIHVASVVERLKGASPNSFDLFMVSVPPSESRYGLADVREISLSAAYRFHRAQAAEADGRHASPTYWHKATMDWPRDGTDSCGGRAAIDPAIRYVVFRDRYGGVTAYAPVQRDDDILLEGLRHLRADPSFDMRSTMRVEDYFRNISDLARVRLERCPHSARNTWTPMRLRAERGDISVFGEASQSDIQILHYFEFRKQACPEGSSILMVNFSPGDPHPHWASRSWLQRWFGHWLPSFDGMLSTLLDPLFDSAPPTQPITIRADGRIAVADIYTHLKLEGPATVSVDDVFRWHEQGRRDRALRRTPPWLLLRAIRGLSSPSP